MVPGELCAEGSAKVTNNQKKRAEAEGRRTGQFLKQENP